MKHVSRARNFSLVDTGGKTLNYSKSHTSLDSHWRASAFIFLHTNNVWAADQMKKTGDSVSEADTNLSVEEAAKDNHI